MLFCKLPMHPLCFWPGAGTDWGLQAVAEPRAMMGRVKSKTTAVKPEKWMMSHSSLSVRFPPARSEQQRHGLGLEVPTQNTAPVETWPPANRPTARTEQTATLPHPTFSSHSPD